MNNAFRDKSKDHKSKHYWFRYLLGQGLNNHNLISLSPYPREISQATMMAGSSRWQSAVIGGNGAWRARMRTTNPKSNRTCLYRRSDRGPVLSPSELWPTKRQRRGGWVLEVPRNLRPTQGEPTLPPRQWTYVHGPRTKSWTSWLSKYALRNHSRPRSTR